MIKIIERNISNESLDDVNETVQKKLNKRSYRKFIEGLLNSLKFENDRKVEDLSFEPVLIETEQGGKVIAAIHMNTSLKEKNIINDIYIPVTNTNTINIPLKYILNTGLKYSSLSVFSSYLKEFGYEKVIYTFREESIEF